MLMCAWETDSVDNLLLQLIANLAFQYLWRHATWVVVHAMSMEDFGKMVIVLAVWVWT